MTFSACGVAFTEVPVDFGKMKAEGGTATSPFGQAPMLEVGANRLCQMGSIMKYIAATSKPELTGKTELAKANTDMLLHSVDDLYLKYISCVYEKELSEEAKASLWTTHFDVASKAERNGGAHMAYLCGYLERSGGPFLDGAQVTVADIFFYFTLEAYTRDHCFGGKLNETYPALVPYMAAVAAVDGVKERLAAEGRDALQFNGNGKG